ncbi:GAF domain-containing protein [Actinopolymorpha sp. B9G3]|uniref:sensor histidine kinase n=1 Tax=Actinopolymorpha sp. B9G3 TaxID=3158970 RepID=UPI0032D8F104
MGNNCERRQVLQRIVETAAQLTVAKYAVLVIVTREKRILEFIPFGVTEERVAKIGERPQFRGILKIVRKTGRALRIADVRTHPARYGIPAHHPVITSLLAVPIKLHGDTEGLLYLANKTSAREFSAADEAAVTALADAAGMTIENSRLFQQERRRERWIEMGAEVTRLLLNPASRDEALPLVLRRIREVSRAFTGVIALVERTASEERIVFEAMDGIETDHDETVSIQLRRPSFLASVIDTGAPILTTDLQDDPQYNPTPIWAALSEDVGLAMFMPLTAEGETMGVLALTWRRGSPDEAVAIEDAELMQSFADQAALALHQQRLQYDRERRGRWLEAGFGLTRLLLNDVDRDEALTMVIRRFRAVSAADYAGLITVDPADADTAVLAVVEGLDLESTAGTRIGRRGLTARVIETRQRVVSDDLTHEPEYDPPPEWAEAMSVIGLGMLIPLVVSGDVFGILYAGWRRGSPQERVGRREIDMVEAFAGQAALALQHVQSQEARARMRVLEDRDRIASDLHDVVIQRLFAVEMRLHSAAGLSTDPQVRQRIDAAIDDLDDMTREVRSTIFSLHHEEGDEASIRSQLLYEIDSARAVLGFTPRLVVRGPVDRGVSPRLRSELVPAVRDALANAAAHLSPTEVEVTVRVTGDELVLTVTDDGTDIGGSPPEARVAELKTRALHLGGSFDVRSGERGNLLEWHVPLAS